MSLILDNKLKLIKYYLSMIDDTNIEYIINKVSLIYIDIKNIKKKLLLDLDRIDYIDDLINNKLINHKNKKIEIISKKNDKIISINDSLKISFPLIQNKLDMVDSICWLNEYDGLFMKLCDNIIIELSLCNYSLDKKNTIDCKFIDRNLCKTENCGYIHIGEEYKKIASLQRCPKNIYFGNIKTIYNDINNIDFNDIKKLLFNTIPDIFLLYLWFKYNNIEEKIIKKEDYLFRNE